LTDGIGGEEVTHTVQGMVAESINSTLTNTLPNLSKYVELNTNNTLLELIADLANVLFTFPQLKSSIPALDHYFSLEQNTHNTTNLIQLMQFILNPINNPTLNNLMEAITSYINVFVENVDNKLLPTLFSQFKNMF
jgi:hypothetical protein